MRYHPVAGDSSTGWQAQQICFNTRSQQHGLCVLTVRFSCTCCTQAQLTCFHHLTTCACCNCENAAPAECISSELTGIEHKMQHVLTTEGCQQGYTVNSHLAPASHLGTPVALPSCRLCSLQTPTRAVSAVHSLQRVAPAAAASCSAHSTGGSAGLQHQLQPAEMCVVQQECSVCELHENSRSGSAHTRTYAGGVSMWCALSCSTSTALHTTAAPV